MNKLLRRTAATSAFLGASLLSGASALAVATPSQVQKTLNQNAIVRDLNTIVNFLAAVVGVVVIATIIIGGIQYSTANGKPDSTAEAKKRITNGLIALVAFFLIWAFVQWLVPGGPF